MRHVFWTPGAISGLILLTWVDLPAAPPEPRGKQAVADRDDDRPPPPPEGERPARGAERFLTVTGTVASLHTNPQGDIDGLKLEEGSEIRFPAEAGEKLAGTVALKDRITIEGWTHPGESEIRVATITHEASGKVLEMDRPPPQQLGEVRPPRPEEGQENADNNDRPPRPRDANGQSRPQPNSKGNRPPKGEQKRQYSLEQATSDRAQLHTIAFDGLAFLTGDFGYDTFLPPGKVSDYFGFQYMRDIDAPEGGHNTSFLTRIANNMLVILNAEQRPNWLLWPRSRKMTSVGSRK